MRREEAYISTLNHILGITKVLHNRIEAFRYCFKLQRRLLGCGREGIAGYRASNLVCCQCPCLLNLRKAYDVECLTLLWLGQQRDNAFEFPNRSCLSISQSEICTDSTDLASRDREAEEWQKHGKNACVHSARTDLHLQPARTDELVRPCR